MATEVKQPSDLPIGLCLGWGIGTLGISIMFNTTAVLMQRFATDYLGVAAATWGTIYLISKLYDAVTDPVMGVISDKTRSRWGRRRPYILLGGILCALAFMGLFHAPALIGGSQHTVLILAGLLIFYSTAYTVFNVPYMAMPAEMTPDYHQRAKLVSFRVYAIGFGTIAGVSAAPILVASFGGGVEGHQSMSLVMGAIIFIAMMICFRTTRTARATTPTTEVHMPFSERFKMVLENKPFLLLLGVKCLQLAGIALNQAVMVYFIVHILDKGYRFLGLYGLIASLGIIVSTPLWLKLSKRFGKKNIYLFATIFYSLFTASWFLSGPEEATAIIFIRAFIVGLGSGGILLMGQAMLPDAIGHDTARTGLNREGVMAGFYTTAEKLAGALGGAISGWFLGYMGYLSSTTGAANQPDSAILAIYLSMSLLPAGVTLISCLFLIPYDLDEAKVRQNAETSA